MDNAGDLRAEEIISAHEFHVLDEGEWDIVGYDGGRTAFSTNEGHSWFLEPVEIPRSSSCSSKGRRSSITRIFCQVHAQSELVPYRPIYKHRGQNRRIGDGVTYPTEIAIDEDLELVSAVAIVRRIERREK